MLEEAQQPTEPWLLMGGRSSVPISVTALGNSVSSSSANGTKVNAESNRRIVRVSAKTFFIWINPFLFCLFCVFYNPLPGKPAAFFAGSLFLNP